MVCHVLLLYSLNGQINICMYLFLSYLKVNLFYHSTMICAKSIYFLVQYYDCFVLKVPLCYVTVQTMPYFDLAIKSGLTCRSSLFQVQGSLHLYPNRLKYETIICNSIDDWWTAFSFSTLGVGKKYNFFYSYIYMRHHQYTQNQNDL